MFRGALGVDLHSFDEAGRAVIGKVGELVVLQPMPSMPLYFWNDTDGHQYRESYFETYPGIWRHGDWLEMTERGTRIIYGRSDATLNRGGVRMGTSDFYRVVEELPEVGKPRRRPQRAGSGGQAVALSGACARVHG